VRAIPVRPVASLLDAAFRSNSGPDPGGYQAANRPRVGCAKGFLVEALRDRRIDAFGIDVSEFAIGEVRPDVRPYCRVSLAVASFDGVYDLIVCIGVLEHMPEHEAD